MKYRVNLRCGAFDGLRRFEQFEPIELLSNLSAI
jgi:hypothetical protein